MYTTLGIGACCACQECGPCTIQPDPRHASAEVIFDRPIARTCHPDFRAARLGEAMSKAANAPLIQVQHHHAHIASVVIENGLPNGGTAVIGLALDGFGLGDDGSAWGDEFFPATYYNADRISRFMPAALPGGDEALDEPWRNLAVAVVKSAAGLADREGLGAVALSSGVFSDCHAAGRHD